MSTTGGEIRQRSAAVTFARGSFLIVDDNSDHS